MQVARLQHENDVMQLTNITFGEFGNMFYNVPNSLFTTSQAADLSLPVSLDTPPKLLSKATRATSAIDADLTLQKAEGSTTVAAGALSAMAKGSTTVAAGEPSATAEGSTTVAAGAPSAMA